MTQLRIITPNLESERKSRIRTYYALCKGLEMTTAEVDKTLKEYAWRNGIPLKQAFEEMEYIARDIQCTIALRGLQDECT